MKICDYLIIGAGIIGLSIARELQQRDSSAKIIIVEKEPIPGVHASTRNSGVLHSGIYYNADSLKARFSRDGNAAWQVYCLEHHLPLDRCGKLIVARDEVEHARLDTLEERGATNGVEVIRVDEQAARSIEPRVRTVGHALFVPSTATIDPKSVVSSLCAQFVAANGTLLCAHPYREHRSKNLILAGAERIHAGTVINCAGLYADRIARSFGFGLNYTLLPFKGLYRYADAGAEAPRAHIYPVPDLRHPFLGVHFTRTVDGLTKIGPTSIPAFWREQYEGLGGYRTRELLEVVGRELSMFVTNNNDFRTLAVQELRKNRRATMVAEAARLLEGAEAMGFFRIGKPGIRAQLVERESNQLVMDFVIEGDAHSVHILNAVSPAFTCAIPFAKHVLRTFLQR